MTKNSTVGDKARFSVIMSPAHQERLAEVAKTYKITQGEVLEVLLDNASHVDTKMFQAVREAKVAAREPKKELLKKLNSLPAEELKKLLSQVQA